MPLQHRFGKANDVVSAAEKRNIPHVQGVIWVSNSSTERHTTEGGRIVKSNPLRSGATTHVSARPTTTTVSSEDVVNWLHDASLRLFEARLARGGVARRTAA
jgi:hypothetical protein